MGLRGIAVHSTDSRISQELLRKTVSVEGRMIVFSRMTQESGK